MLLALLWACGPQTASYGNATRVSLVWRPHSDRIATAVSSSRLLQHCSALWPQRGACAMAVSNVAQRVNKKQLPTDLAQRQRLRECSQLCNSLGRTESAANEGSDAYSIEPASCLVRLRRAHPPVRRAHMRPGDPHPCRSLPVFLTEELDIDCGGRAELLCVALSRREVGCILYSRSASL
jgi:hypothetical protein